MTRAALIALAFGIATPALAQLPSPPPEISVNTSRNDPYPAHDVTFLNGAKGIPDVTYATLSGYGPLTLDIYLPPDSVRRPVTGFPLVIYIHGGAWLAGNSRRAVPFADFPGVLASLAAHGYVVASVNYRLSGTARFPAQIEDVKSAIHWLKTNASRYGIDKTRVLTWGVSAGGYLAVLAATTCGNAALQQQQQQQVKSIAPDATNGTVRWSRGADCVQGAVSWYGVFDMSTITAQATQDKAMSREDRTAPEWQLIGCFGNKECTPKQLATASPVTYVASDDPPMLLIVGSEDTLVPYQQTLEMADRLRAAGVTHQVMVIPGVSHSLIGKTAEQTRDANLKALAATFSFIDQTIGNSARSGR